MSNQLAVQEVALSEPSVASMLQGVIERGITTENVAALDKLVGLYERMQTKNAEQEFARAFVALQSEMPSVQASRAVPNNDGTIRYKFAPYEEIMRQVQPMLTKHGFSMTFDTKVGDGRMTSVCTLMHTGGHSRSNEFAVRIGQGPPKATECQADGAAKTYAKRGALCDALGVVIEHDTDGDDARGLGAVITLKEAADLRDRAEACGADIPKLLAFAAAATFEAIHESKMPDLDRELRRREAKKSK